MLDDADQRLREEQDMLSYMMPGGENRSSRLEIACGKGIACCPRQLKE